MGLEKLDTNGIKMIVYADDHEAVERATNLSSEGPAGTERFVVEITQGDWQAIKNKLHPDQTTDQINFEEVRVMALSTINKIADIIKKGDFLSYPRVGLAYGKSGLSEFN